MSTTLYWGAVRECELSCLTSCLDELSGEAVYAAIDYQLGARLLDDVFLPALQKELPSQSLWDKASEVRLFWENACLLAIRSNDLWSFSIMSEQKTFFEAENLTIHSEDVQKIEKVYVYPISNWSRFISTPENMPECFKVIEYSGDSLSGKPWRIWAKD